MSTELLCLGALFGIEMFLFLALVIVRNSFLTSLLFIIIAYYFSIKLSGTSAGFECVSLLLVCVVSSVAAEMKKVSNFLMESNLGCTDLIIYLLGFKGFSV
jgi:hypothetical protein